jgi:hypothetical protein
MNRSVALGSEWGGRGEGKGKPFTLTPVPHHYGVFINSITMTTTVTYDSHTLCPTRETADRCCHGYWAGEQVLGPAAVQPDRTAVASTSTISPFLATRPPDKGAGEARGWWVWEDPGTHTGTRGGGRGRSIRVAWLGAEPRGCASGRAAALSVRAVARTSPASRSAVGGGEVDRDWMG